MVLGGQKKSCCFGEVAVVQKRLLQYIIQSVLQISVLERCPDNYAPAMKWRRVYSFTLHHSSICFLFLQFTEDVLWRNKRKYFLAEKKKSLLELWKCEALF